MQMKDIPVFTTDYGVASLILAEIPYKQTAYIHIRSSLPGETEKLIDECVGFCKACGAEQVFATASEPPENLPLHHIIYEMRGQYTPGEQGCLWPVTEESLSLWQETANHRLAGVDGSATITASYARDLLHGGGAYFVHEEQKLLGIGLIQQQTLHLIAATVPGAGEKVLRTLLSLCPREPIRLEVASTNLPALRLYERQGFLKTGEIARWYRAL